ncbi:MAG TPA: protein kinase [Trebonia sp.]|nr:protein kinase [Trebonia sp.]
MAEFPSSSADQQLAGFQPGTLIGGYRLEDRIGAGGMAMVFRAKDETLDRSVALKILTPTLTADSDFRERFVRESRSASLVDHPNIIPVYAAGEDRGVLYLAMRYVSGGDLHSLVRREGPLPPRRVVSLLAPVASALDAAHGVGVIHRDVKPANVLVDVSPNRPEHPYLSDFGLAKREAMQGMTLTHAGEFVGTAGFVSPEQISGEAPQAASDQYALGCVAYILLTGQLPFKGKSAEAMLWAQMSGPAPQAVPLRPDLPTVTDGVLGRALAREPGQRFATCAEFVDALGRALSGEGQVGGPGFGRPYAGPVPGPGPGHPSFPESSAPPPAAGPSVPPPAPVSYGPAGSNPGHPSFPGTPPPMAGSPAAPVPPGPAYGVQPGPVRPGPAYGIQPGPVPPGPTYGVQPGPPSPAPMQQQSPGQPGPAPQAPMQQAPMQPWQQPGKPRRKDGSGTAAIIIVVVLGVIILLIVIGALSS